MPRNILGQHPGGEEEPRPGLYPPVPAGTERPAGDDGVDMDVAAEVLPPGVQDHGEADLPAEPPGIAAELQEGAGCGLEEQVVDEAGIAGDDGVEVVGQREHHMPVADVEEPGALALDPAGLGKGLALGAVPVAAGGVLDGAGAAFAARGGEPPERGGAAVHHRPGGPELPIRDRVFPAVVVEPGAQDVGHLQRRPRGRRRMAGAVHRSAAARLRGLRQFQQVQWGRRGPVPALGQVEILHGGPGRGVAHPPLDVVELDAGLDQVGGIAMAQ